MRIKFGFKQNLDSIQTDYDIKDFSALLERAQEIANAHLNFLVLSFVDLEDEVTILSDERDFEYFVECVKQNSECNMVTIKIQAQDASNVPGLTLFDDFNHNDIAHDNLSGKDDENVQNIQDDKSSQNVENAQNIQLVQNQQTVPNVNINASEELEQLDEEQMRTFGAQIDVFEVDPSLQSILEAPYDSIDRIVNEKNRMSIKDVSFDELQAHPEYHIDPNQLHMLDEAEADVFVTLNENRREAQKEIEIHQTESFISLSELKSFNQGTFPEFQAFTPEQFGPEAHFEPNDINKPHTTTPNSDHFDLMGELSAIMLTKKEQVNNQISTNFNFTKNNETPPQGDNKEVPVSDLINRMMKHVEKTDIGQPEAEQLEKVNSAEDKVRIRALEQKLDVLNELFMDSFNSIREEIQYSTELMARANTVRNDPKESFVSGVMTRHNLVSCNNCGKKNFIGKRFKCLECLDYDLCESCEARNIHDHPMIRLTKNNPREDNVHLNKIYRYFKNIEQKPNDKVKEGFLRVLTKNEYGDVFYKHMVASYTKMTLEQFISEMINKLT